MEALPMSLIHDDLKTKIETGNYWIDSLITREGSQWHMNYVGLFRSYITYSFDSYPSLLDITESLNGDYEYLNSTQSSNIKRALAYITDFIGIEFVEVNKSDADWYFFTGDYEESEYTAFSKWQYYYNYDPGSREITRLDYDGVIIFDNAEYQSITQTLAYETYGYELLLHELGHLLGLKHPFDGPVTLNNNLDSTNYTLMSYNDATPYKTEFSAFDKSALMYLYGLDGLGGKMGFKSPINVVVGSQFSELITGSEKVDLFIQFNPDNDELQGGGGIDTVKYSGSLVDYSWTKEGNKVNVLDAITETGDLLFDVERLQFNDVSLAFDLDGNAGKIVKLLGIMFGKDNWYNKDQIGVGLDLLDSGTVSYEALMDQWFSKVIGSNPSNTQVANLILTNLNGQAPTPAELNWLTSVLDIGAYTQGGLGVLVADLERNITNINLVGLIDSGVEYFRGSDQEKGLLVEGDELDNDLIGSAGNDTLSGNGGRDTLQGFAGDDVLIGGDDIDNALFQNDLVDYSIVNNAGQLNVTGPMNDGSDSLIEVERLHFQDQSLAFDLNGNAGTTAKILGVAFGKDNWQNKEAIGALLDVFDNSATSPEVVMDFLFSEIIEPNPSNTQVANLIITNLNGEKPTPAELHWLTSVLDIGAYTQGGLGVLVADLEQNTTNINLVGLIDTGLEYLTIG